MVKQKRNKWVVFCLLIACALFVLSGCAEKTSTSQVDLPAISNTVGNNPDIELPSDMKLDNDDSMAINTDSFRGGVLHYSGRVEINSLKDFIVASMENHHWKLVGEASYKRILLAFIKPNKTCMTIIKEGIGGSWGNTEVTLYLTVDKSGGKGIDSGMSSEMNSGMDSGMGAGMNSGVDSGINPGTASGANTQNKPVENSYPK